MNRRDRLKRAAAIIRKAVAETGLSSDHVEPCLNIGDANTILKIIQRDLAR